MARVLFLTVDGGGNLPPALAIADELARRGHRTAFLGHERQRERIVSRGHGFHSYRHARPWSAEDRRALLADVSAFVRLLADRGFAVDLREHLAEEPVDVVVLDCLIPGSIQAASTLPVPRVVLMHSLAESWLHNASFRLAGRLARTRLAPAWESADLVLVATQPELDPAYGTLPERYVWTGVCETPPLEPPAPATPPRVLVSLSTTWTAGQDAVLGRVLEALEGLPLRAVVTTGPTIEPASLRLPANAEAHRYVPHHELLPTCSLVVGHAGHSTTARALAHGLPLLLVPTNTMIDQPLVAEVVARAGAGIAVRKTASAAELRESIGLLLEDGSYAAAARDLAASIRASAGTVTAAGLIAGRAVAEAVV